MSDLDSLKQQLHSDELIVGVSVPLTADQNMLENILERDSYGFLSVDSQHAAFNEETLVEFCDIAERLRIPVVFRIKHTRQSYMIGNYMDLGPTGAEVPQVEEESTVEESIDYFYYPQRGKRSWGGDARWGIKGRDDRLQYAEWWNNTGVLWMQVESIEAITKIKKLAKLGIDCISWGPMDLSFNRESHPDHPFKTDDDCVQYVLNQLNGTDVTLCYRNFDPSKRDKYIQMGVTVILEPPRE